MMRALLACAVASALVVLSGCGEKAQTAGTRKNDVAPAQGAMGAYTAPGWTKGDAVNWEAHLKKRADGQNEYTRTNRN